MKRLDPGTALLPAPAARYAAASLEEVRYSVRPGLRALPAGSGMLVAFMVPQLLIFGAFLWIIWFPAPATTRTLVFNWVMTVLLVAMNLGMIWRIYGRSLRFLPAALRAPFVRLTVTNARLLWSVPWASAPILEIDGERIIGVLLGDHDSRGFGSVALQLYPGDPDADEGGRIHLDALPEVTRFVEAVRLLG